MREDIHHHLGIHRSIGTVSLFASFFPLVFFFLTFASCKGIFRGLCLRCGAKGREMEGEREGTC